MAPGRNVNKPSKRRYEPEIPSVRASTRKRVNLAKMQDASLRRYSQFYNLGEAKNKEQLLLLCSNHFASDAPEPADVLGDFFCAIGRKNAKLIPKAPGASGGSSDVTTSPKTDQS